MPEGTEEEPSSDADDDFDEPEPRGANAQRKRADAETIDNTRAADLAIMNGVPARRP